MIQQVFAGVDGGGTKTAIVLVNADGEEIARDTTTTSNAAVIGHDQAGNVLREIIQSTAARTGTTGKLTAVWCGLSGSDRPEDHAALRPRLDDLTDDLRMTNDAELAIGGLPNRVGVALVSGTGSIAFGRNIDGKRTRAGGWGHIFSDEGSGYDVARQALRAFAASVDGFGPATSLVNRLMEYYQIKDPFTIINRVYDPSTTKGDIARLSTIVVDEATRGDAVAQDILDTSARDLARYADAVGRRLAIAPELHLATVGGMLNNVEHFRTAVIEALRQHWMIGEVIQVTDPALTAAQSLAAEWKGATA